MTTNPLLSDAVVEAVARSMCAYEHTDYGQYSKIMRDAAKDALTAAHKALTAAGYAVAPVEPTAKMIVAGAIPTRVINLGSGQTAQGFGLGADPRSIYKAMLSAAHTTGEATQ